MQLRTRPVESKAVIGRYCRISYKNGRVSLLLELSVQECVFVRSFVTAGWSETVHFRYNFPLGLKAETNLCHTLPRINIFLYVVAECTITIVIFSRTNAYMRAFFKCASATKRRVPSLGSFPHPWPPRSVRDGAGWMKISHAYQEPRLERSGNPTP